MWAKASLIVERFPEGEGRVTRAPNTVGADMPPDPAAP